MKNSLKSIVVLFMLIGFWSCDDDTAEITVTPPKDHAEQFAAEKKGIEQFLNDYYPLITYNSNGDVTKIEIKRSLNINDGKFMDFYDTEYAENVNETNPSLPYPRLIKKNFQHQGITYSYWYFMVKPGAATKIPYGYTNPTSARPTELDGVLVDYKGYVLKDTFYNSSNTYVLREKSFEETSYPVEFRLNSVVRGWSRILPKFGSSDNRTINADGSIEYQNYGSGIMIFPSGMGYYNQSSTKIPAYVPLVFTFNLYDIKRYDHDQDGIMSYREDYNNDGYFYANFDNALNDDKDEDGIVDCLDYDDDGDGIITYREVINPSTGLPFLDKDYEELSKHWFVNINGEDVLFTNNCEGTQNVDKSYLDKTKKRTVGADGTQQCVPAN